MICGSSVVKMSQGLRMDNHTFDVTLSFAGEDRDYVDVVANKLKANSIKVD